MKKILIGIILLAAILGGGYWYFMLRGPKLGADYQAVFLSNGQVYFGKVRDLDSGNPRLTDVYYLVVQQALQQAEAAGADKDAEVVTEGEMAAQPEKPQYTLVKMGKELHGPEDEITLNRKHILFVEDLKDSSKVVQKIKEFEESGGGN